MTIVGPIIARRQPSVAVTVICDREWLPDPPGPSIALSLATNGPRIGVPAFASNVVHLG
jgi:hypothetical protein